jgi:hypothetical protein
LIRDILIIGTHRALLTIMTDTDVIEAINFEQLATMTDRLLLRHGRGQHRLLPVASIAPISPITAAADRFRVPSLVERTPATSSVAAWPVARVESTVHGYRVSGPRRALARGSQSSLRDAVAAPSAVAHGFAADESTSKKTLVVHRPRLAAVMPAQSRLHWLAVTVVIPALLGTAVGLLLLL